MRQIRWPRRATHPKHRGSVRWWVAQASLPALLSAVLLSLVTLAVLVAGLYVWAEDQTRSGPYQGRGRIFMLTLAAMRALLGIDGLPRQADNPVHEALATVTGTVGVVLPAMVIGIVIVRIFTVRVFEWRRRISVCIAAELDGDMLRESKPEPHHAFLAIRWYRRLNNVTVTNLQADAYLQIKTLSRVDGTVLYRYQRLKVLDLDGAEAPTCTWPETFSGMPFTLWIPLHAALCDGRIVAIQDRELNEQDQRELVVRVTGQVARPTGQLSEERRYDLVDDIQLGRFVPVRPDLARPPRSWLGWNRFERALTHGVFVYDAVIAACLLTSRPRAIRVIPATLHGYRRVWQMTGSESWLAQDLTPAADASTQGVLVPVDAGQLTDLDQRYDHYERIRVNNDLDTAAPRPDVVWAYVGKAHWVTRTRATLQAGTAAIDMGSLDRLHRAVAAFPELADALLVEPIPPGVRIIHQRAATE